MYETPANESANTLKYNINPLSSYSPSQIKTWIAYQKNRSEYKFNHRGFHGRHILTIYTCGHQLRLCFRAVPYLLLPQGCEVTGAKSQKRIRAALTRRPLFVDKVPYGTLCTSITPPFSGSICFALLNTAFSMMCKQRAPVRRENERSVLKR
jgi:hypothetical protein